MSAVVPGDRAPAAVRVQLPADGTFRVITWEIDLWWRRGSWFGSPRSTATVMHIEPKLGEGPLQPPGEPESRDGRRPRAVSTAGRP